MAYAATLSAQDNLFVYNPKTLSVDFDSTKGDALLNDVKSHLDFVNAVGVFRYANRLRISFTLESSATTFALLRGLIEFHRPKNYLFSYSRELKTLEVDLNESELDGLKSFLIKVGGWYRAEQNFRRSLKRILDFEEKYKVEQRRLYASLQPNA